MNDAFTQQLREAAIKSGVDLVGIAPVSRFDEVAPEHHPAAIFPEVKSVITLGKRIARGCLRGTEEGTQLVTYRTYGMNWIPNNFLAYSTVAVASCLEDSRFEAVPLPDLPPETPPMGVPVRPGLQAPNVMIDFRDAAVRCGLGHIGLTGELMTPEFGHLQRIHLILTDAELEPSPVFKGNLCDGCQACADVCPFNAIDTSVSETTAICGIEMRTAPINEGMCAHCQNGVEPNPSHRAGRPDRLAALCMRSCSLLQDRRDKLNKPVNKPFRDKPSWVIGRDGIPGLTEKEM